jgi:hypothetical protein
MKCSIVIALSKCPPTTIVACHKHYQVLVNLNAYRNSLFLNQTKVENIRKIIVPSASVLQPFQDSQVCHALNMPTIHSSQIIVVTSTY